MAQPSYLKMDPVRDHETIVKWMVVDTWAFDLVRSIELALLKTFSVPSIAKILVDSREFLDHTQKRYDDTDLLLSMFIERGYTSVEGREAIRRINRMHAVHPITNDQMLYVLSTFVIDPIIWMSSYGWRPLMPVEEQALFHFWIAVGKLMGITDLFTDLEAMRAYHTRYEAECMVYSDNNLMLYKGVVPTVARNLPFPLSILTAKLLPAIMSPRMCAAFGITPAGKFIRLIVEYALRTRGRIDQLLPRKPHWRLAMKRRTYPNGFTIKELGVSNRPKLASCPVRHIHRPTQDHTADLSA
ncbi:MAG: DUF2236 domain-containing protein [Deltaproteobacteria bacterium]|nr:DUF2236 domain-containing protein [Deltaproteobacteria bacterium]